MQRAIDISDLPQPLIDAIETIVRAYRERVASAMTGQSRQTPENGSPRFREVKPLRVAETPASEILLQDRQ